MTCGQHGIRIYRNRSHRRFSDVTAASGFPVIASGGTEKTPYYQNADLADLDRDRDLDLVGIRDDRLTYRLNDGHGVFRAQQVIKRITGGRDVATGDADDDGDIDIYALRSNDPYTDLNRRDVLFVNAGLRFSRHVAPYASGRADTVERLNYDADGDADFLVLNGKDVPGPVQLISYR